MINFSNQSDSTDKFLGTLGVGTSSTPIQALTIATEGINLGQSARALKTLDMESSFHTSATDPKFHWCGVNVL